MSLFEHWRFHDVKWKLNIPWMDAIECAALAKMRGLGLSSFHVAICKGVSGGKRCTNEVPNVTNDQGKQAKRYCSKTCYTNAEGIAE